MTATRTPLVAAILAELAEADEAAKRELARQLQPYLDQDGDRLLDVSEKAAQLQVHPDTLVRWARSGRIWAKKIGREWRFRADRDDVLPATAPAVSPPLPPRRRQPAASPASFAAIRGRS